MGKQFDPSWSLLLRFERWYQSSIESRVVSHYWGRYLMLYDMKWSSLLVGSRHSSQTRVNVRTPSSSLRLFFTQLWVIFLTFMCWSFLCGRFRGKPLQGDSDFPSEKLSPLCYCSTKPSVLGSPGESTRLWSGFQFPKLKLKNSFKRVSWGKFGGSSPLFSVSQISHLLLPDS